MTFVYITDSNYAMPTCVSIVSLIENISKDQSIEIYVIADRLSDKEIDNFNSLGNARINIHVIRVNGEEYYNISQKRISKKLHVTPTSLYKFNLDSLLENEDLVLYLDGDTIINADISDLFDLDISEYYMAAAYDMGDEYDEEGYSLLAKNVNHFSKHYYNSGVMLLNLKKMRIDRISEKLLDYRENGMNFYMDQDTFNCVLEDHIYAISNEYNFLISKLLSGDFEQINSRYYGNKLRSEQECLRRQKIFHFTTRYKPWIYNIPDYSQLFEKYYNVSPYRGQRLEQKNVLEELFRSNLEAWNQIHQKQWRFPKSIIPKDSKIIIYGAGDMGKDYQDWIKDTRYCNLLMIVDGNYKKHGIDVKAPEEMNKIEFDYVLIAVWDEKAAKQIREHIKKLGIRSEKILWER